MITPSRPPSLRSLAELSTAPPSTPERTPKAALKADFEALLAFEASVSGYNTRPVRIDYTDAHGEPRFAYPDYLVHFLPNLFHGTSRKLLLIELLERTEWLGQTETCRLRFAAARGVALERGWLFQVFIERDLPGVRVQNIRFLRSYLHGHHDQATDEALLECLGTLRRSTLQGWWEAYLHRNSHSPHSRQALPQMLRLVAARTVAIDLNTPLSPSSAVWHHEFAIPEDQSRTRWL